MARRLGNWIKGYIDYTSASEAPNIFHFWTAVSTIAGALRRNVYIDQVYFRWVPNFYIIFVAPPGIVNKSTTIDIGMRLLRNVPDVFFGPESVTWQALITSLSNAKSLVEYSPGEDLVPACCLTIPVSELGTFLTVKDDKMIDHLVSLWDGKVGEFEKATKTQGNDSIQNPWVNIIAGTTPSWVTSNFPMYMIGGGFTSRAIFVYADQKRQYVAYPKYQKTAEIQEVKELLIEDLITIGNLRGEFQMTKDAIEYGEQWYKDLFEKTPLHLKEETMGGYLARKQTHIHKLAMVLAVAESDKLVITRSLLEKAIQITDSNEENFSRVFKHIGASAEGALAQSLIRLVAINGKLPVMAIYNALMLKASKRQIDDAISICQKSGRLDVFQDQHGHVFLRIGKTSS